MINKLSNDTYSSNSSGHASLSSNVFKIECQNPFVPLQVHVGRGIVTMIIAVQCGLALIG